LQSVARHLLEAQDAYLEDDMHEVYHELYMMAAHISPEPYNVWAGVRRLLDPASTRQSPNILKHVTSEWTKEPNDDAVTCHHRMIEGVLCRWWGDGPTPDGVAIIDKAADLVSTQLSNPLEYAEIKALMLRKGSGESSVSIPLCSKCGDYYLGAFCPCSYEVQDDAPA